MRCCSKINMLIIPLVFFLILIIPNNIKAESEDKNIRFSLLTEAWWAKWKVLEFHDGKSENSPLYNFDIDKTLITGVSGEMGTEYFGIGVEYLSDRFAKENLPEDVYESRENFFENVDFFMVNFVPRIYSETYAVLSTRVGIFEGVAKREELLTAKYSKVSGPKKQEFKTVWFKQDIFFMSPAIGKMRGFGLGPTFMYFERPLFLLRYEKDNSIPEASLEYTRITQYMFSIGYWTLPVYTGENVDGGFLDFNMMSGLGWAHLEFRDKKLDTVCGRVDFELYYAYKLGPVMAKVGVMVIINFFGIGEGGPRTATISDEQLRGEEEGKIYYEEGYNFEYWDIFYGPMISFGAVF